LPGATSARCSERRRPRTVISCQTMRALLLSASREVQVGAIVWAASGSVGHGRNQNGAQGRTSSILICQALRQRWGSAKFPHYSIVRNTSSPPKSPLCAPFSGWPRMTSRPKAAIVLGDDFCAQESRSAVNGACHRLNRMASADARRFTCMSTR
jgi:hypothetical protein